MNVFAIINIMHDSVRNAFIQTTGPLDGQVNHMYCDDLRRVVCAIGVKLPTADSATMLSWRWKDTNKRASSAEIRAEWVAIERIGSTGPDNSRTAMYYSNFASLYMVDTEIYRSTINALLDLEESTNKPKGYRYWPADAQMAYLQIIWFGDTPNDELSKALDTEDWETAKDLAVLDYTARSALIKKLFTNAQIVANLNLNKAKYWGEAEPRSF